MKPWLVCRPVSFRWRMKVLWLLWRRLGCRCRRLSGRLVRRLLMCCRVWRVSLGLVVFVVVMRRLIFSRDLVLVVLRFWLVSRLCLLRLRVLRQRCVLRRMGRVRLRLCMCVGTQVSRFWVSGTTRVWSLVVCRGGRGCVPRIVVRRSLKLYRSGPWCGSSRRFATNESSWRVSCAKRKRGLRSTSCLRLCVISKG